MSFDFYDTSLFNTAVMYVLCSVCFEKPIKYWIKKIILYICCYGIINYSYRYSVSASTQMSVLVFGRQKSGIGTSLVTTDQIDTVCEAIYGYIIVFLMIVMIF